MTCLVILADSHNDQGKQKKEHSYFLEHTQQRRQAIIWTNGDVYIYTYICMHYSAFMN